MKSALRCPAHSLCDVYSKLAPCHVCQAVLTAVQGCALLPAAGTARYGRRPPAGAFPLWLTVTGGAVTPLGGSRAVCNRMKGSHALA
jgi:hypothetical protein